MECWQRRNLSPEAGEASQLGTTRLHEMEANIKHFEERTKEKLREMEQSVLMTLTVNRKDQKAKLEKLQKCIDESKESTVPYEEFFTVVSSLDANLKSVVSTTTQSMDQIVEAVKAVIKSADDTKEKSASLDQKHTVLSGLVKELHSELKSKISIEEMEQHMKAKECRMVEDIIEEDPHGNFHHNVYRQTRDLWCRVAQLETWKSQAWRDESFNDSDCKRNHGRNARAGWAEGEQPFVFCLVCEV